MLYLEICLTSPIPDDFYDQCVRFAGKTLYQPERGELWNECYVEGNIQPLASTDRVVKARLLIRFREPLSLRYGDHLELEGELREPKGRRIRTRHGGCSFWRWTERLRRRVEQVIDSAYQEYPDHVQILKGMLLGKRSGIQNSTIAAFHNSGSLHILAVFRGNAGNHSAG